MSVKRRIYHSFSNSLLRTSEYFTKLSFKIESENENKKVSEEIKENNKSYVIGAIISSVAFLESTISELFWSAAKNPTGFARELNENLRDRMAKTYNDFSDTYKKMSTLEKYQYSLMLNGQNLFYIDMNPFQNAFLVIKLRNELIHFEPEMIDAEENIQIWENRLKGKFNQCSFYSEPPFLFFPHRCLSHGCARWAVISCINFVNDFYKKIGVDKKY
jgi:hypothetical protein